MALLLVLGKTLSVVYDGIFKCCLDADVFSKPDLTKTLAAQYGDKGIRCNAIVPGGKSRCMKTDLHGT